MRLVFVLSLFCAATAAAQTPPTQLIGRVIEHGKTDGISGASVKIDTGLSAVTDKRGWFSLNVPDGRHEIVVEMLGYQTRRDSISILPGRTQDITVTLSTKAIELQPVVVTVRSRWLEENGFYERRMSGLAPRVITAAELERRGRSTLTEVFGEIPSIRVFSVGTGNSSVRRIVRFMSGEGGLSSRNSRIPGCEPALFIDGRRYQDRMTASPSGIIDSWDVIPPIAIEAIEIFRGGGAPMMYNDNCGSILIWTKRGG